MVSVRYVKSYRPFGLPRTAKKVVRVVFGCACQAKSREMVSSLLPYCCRNLVPRKINLTLGYGV